MVGEGSIGCGLESVGSVVGGDMVRESAGSPGVGCVGGFVGGSVGAGEGVGRG